jgi:hypothetical protein
MLHSLNGLSIPCALRSQHYRYMDGSMAIYVYMLSSVKRYLLVYIIMFCFSIMHSHVLSSYSLFLGIVLCLISFQAITDNTLYVHHAQAHGIFTSS